MSSRRTLVIGAAGETGRSTKRQLLKRVAVRALVHKADVRSDELKHGERTYSKLFYWNKLDKGGHFAAFEQPAFFTEEMRKAFRQMR